MLITNIHNSRIRISPQQTHGTPGIILSQQIPLLKIHTYSVLTANFEILLVFFYG